MISGSVPTAANIEKVCAILASFSMTTVSSNRCLEISITPNYGDSGRCIKFYASVHLIKLSFTTKLCINVDNILMRTQLVIEETSPRRKEGVKRLSSSYDSEEAVLESAKALVESGLLEVWQRGMTAQALVNKWSALGEEVYVVPDNGEPCFSASEYARAYAGELASRGRA